jgi:hypothetical protein
MATIDLTLPENKNVVVMRNGKRVVTAVAVNVEENWVEIQDLDAVALLPETEFTSVEEDILTETGFVEIPVKKLFGNVSIVVLTKDK